MNFEHLYRAHFAGVWRALRRFGVPEKDAQDATQEVFLVAYRREAGFEARSSIKTWLIGIAYRVAANRRRLAATRREVLGEAALAAADERVDPYMELEQRALLRRLDSTLATLPLEQRAVFTMFELEGLSGEEIAEALGIPLGTVRSRLRLARESFTRASGPLDRDQRAVAAGGSP